jgi:hypothetical protein
MAEERDFEFNFGYYYPVLKFLGSGAGGDLGGHVRWGARGDLTLLFRETARGDL